MTTSDKGNHMNESDTARVKVVPLTADKYERWDVLVPVRLIEIEERFQRDLDRTRLARMVKRGWSLFKCGTLDAGCNFNADGTRNGTFRIIEDDGVKYLDSYDGTVSIVDGQHRYHLAMRCGVTYIPCSFYPNMTYEDQAIEFAEQDENVKTVSKTAKFRAKIEGKDPLHLRLRNRVREHGYDALALTPVYDMAFGTKGSIELVDKTLAFTNEVFGADPKRSNKVVLIGVSRLLKESDPKVLDLDALKRNLQGFNVDTIMVKAQQNKANGRGKSVTSGFTNFLIEKHNFKKHDKSRLSYID